MPSCQTGAALSSGHDQAGENKASRLLEMLRQVKDFRAARGKMYDLHFVLAVAVVATLAGAANYRQIGRRSGDLPQRLLAQIGAPYDYFRAAYVAPGESTIREVLTNVDADLLDLLVGVWLHECATRDHDGDLVISLDGKVLRGAWTTGNKQVKLFAAMIHGEGVVVAQTQVPDDTNETTQVENLVKILKHKRGRTIATADAAHTQFRTAILLHKRGIDYVLTVKRNQPTLYRQVFERCLPLLQQTPGHDEEERSHGRIKRWTTWTTTAEDIRFPFARTIAVIRRDEFDLEGNRLTREYAFIITNLRGGRAAPAAIHTHVRLHWGIENRVHYIRDTAWQEDACRAHLGNGPRNLAILRNLALGLLRLHGVKKVKEALEHIAADRNRALQFLAT
ncbi:ISAs1 family transposase [Pseudofrankia sp. BMG5.37]|uniref:ISAs1 family transposase n=1 Tax=Pseudofrankia sp. BMG5.37 TaxID=3050035 RepID=UPI0028951304|nr:ISAs1 family transposase [Pseudofrankia sp. BMG5.37]MDT3440574.1 ISAs1 family transposase [Pseudofrankia sp. BMG5.37]MDT3442933.1 ISAs1 family transposase [Pseudofrankia sp. BMG5.37]MDT3444268.1 ISAs1 family transposase [Pseudofrankia sp. BMG5.37]MDT3446610.1 ISAs1 family transposase [Pseudofrankia sp. BMG5.37]